ncbi:alpha/beta hydrolase family protein [Krasilnikovia sp. MM14-A1259]|uniref:alpha/beta hydrolase family protein n=1 Tax=Krasilnikovia sp. MM14-A1259 TaxID=3373539 RepID=UPI0038090AE2
MAYQNFMNPFVLPVDVRESERHGAVDLYLPDTAQPRPAVLFIHGGPIGPEISPSPRHWPIFQAYASLAASRGLVGATVDHRLHAVTDYAQAADDIAAAVEQLRADPRVDADRVALWFFSGGSPIMADWLRTTPSWLRCLATTYGILSCPPEYGTRFNPADAVAQAGDLPIVMTRVGREIPELAETQATFVAAAEACGARLDIVDVPNGRHSFEILDDTDESREAIERAFDLVVTSTVGKELDPAT